MSAHSWPRGIRTQKRWTTIIEVKQNAVAALRIANTYTSLDNGRFVFLGELREVVDSRELRNAYLAV
ncbi:hypothetical protein [Microvirga massiliensis]|uniref:hypothetical protein n=1 Tax=Microvirga massiliensis TaxID=1033741 RepID=UPI000A63C505|nr:hypothetical protein [Microvirga massiliensis]